VNYIITKIRHSKGQDQDSWSELGGPANRWRSWRVYGRQIL